MDRIALHRSVHRSTEVSTQWMLMVNAKTTQNQKYCIKMPPSSLREYCIPCRVWESSALVPMCVPQCAADPSAPVRQSPAPVPAVPAERCEDRGLRSRAHALLCGSGHPGLHMRSDGLPFWRWRRQNCLRLRLWKVRWCNNVHPLSVATSIATMTSTSNFHYCNCVDLLTSLLIV